MKKKDMIFYICDNELYILDEKKRCIVTELKSVQEEEIVNSNLFQKEISDIIKHNHIKISLFGKNIVFLKSVHLSQLSKDKYEEILKDYFRKIQFVEIEKILKIDNESGVVLITPKYIDYSYMKKGEKKFLRVPLALYNENTLNAVKNIFSLQYKPKKVLVLGTVKDIGTIAEEIEKRFKIKTTFPEDHFFYLIREYKK